MNKWMLWLLLLVCSPMAWGQVPQAMSFQAVARNAGGNPLSEKTVGVKVEVLLGSSSGTVVYAETHRPTTAKNGVVNLQIGNGTAVEGTFAAIDWSRSPYFLRISMDTDGGTSYKEVATQQMLSVPYALYAEKAGATEDKEKHQFLAMPINPASSRLLTGIGEFGGHFDIYIFVSYLDRSDQEVEVEISGLPKGSSFDDEFSSESGPFGRHVTICYQSYDATPGTYNCTFTLKNKYGVTQTYPFTLTILEEFGPGGSLSPETYWKTDEEVRSALTQLVDPYRSYKSFNEAIDDAFMKKEGTDATYNPYAVFTSKSYTPSNPDLYSLWREAYAVIRNCNVLIKGVSESTSSEITESVRTNALKQAHAIRAYCHLMLTEWFGRVPIIQKELTKDEVMNLTQSEREEVLAAVIADLEAAQNIVSLLDTPGEITSEEARILLLESHLMKKDWEAASQVGEGETGLAGFIKRLAMWKDSGGQPTETTEETLMEEYMKQYQPTYHRGNLYLNVLEYSADYFQMDAYKALLPIPQSEIDLNPNITQNEGYK